VYTKVVIAQPHYITPIFKKKDEELHKGHEDKVIEIMETHKEFSEK
jgi:hypothetical protein